MNQSDNSKGILLACLGVLILSPDSLLIRLINIDLWTLMFLRGVFMALSLLFLNFIINRKQLLKQFLHFDRYTWGIVVALSISNFFFVSAIQHTSVAHTLIIVGATPIVTALLGLIFLREKVAFHTWVIIVIVVISLIFVINDDRQSSLTGDVYAAVVCVLWSGIYILARKTKMSNMIAPMIVSGVLIAIFNVPLLNLEPVTLDQYLLGLLLGFLVGVAFSLITLAPRYIPAAEVAIFMSAETVFGVWWVWIFIGEFPGPISLVAGLIIILAIIFNSYLNLNLKKS